MRVGLGRHDPSSGATIAVPAHQQPAAQFGKHRPFVIDQVQRRGVRRQEGDRPVTPVAAGLGRAPARQGRRQVDAIGPAVMAALTQDVDLVIGMVGRGQVDRVLALKDRARPMPHQGDGVAQARGEDGAVLRPPAGAQIGVPPHLGRRGAVGAGALGVSSRPTPRVQTTVAGRPDIDQQSAVAVEDEAGQGVAIVVQPVVRQVADHGPHRRRRIGRVRVQGQDAVHLGHIDPSVRSPRHRVRHGQPLGEPAPARRPVGAERQPPDGAASRLPPAQVGDEPVSAGQGQQAARHAGSVSPRALPDQAQTIARRHPHRGRGSPAAIAVHGIGA
ncbi:hypothetical protein BREV_BREV_01397 [Brevundimonas mediterranea]|uniref:Uncharacterized protein n=1 Tax=Brevundimonas mediterranea TaxID=74329 RepID=A0A7Z8Y373_9CAUL|nr:hypothetical protein BREV_BREV_01397 [Brevundimonas mediterranea]